MLPHKGLTKRERMLLRLAGALVEHPGASVERLAEIAETSRGTLYRIARSREDLIAFLRGHAIQIIDQVMDGADLEGGEAEAVLLNLTRGFINYPDFCVFSASSSHMNPGQTEDESVDIEGSYKARMNDFFSKWQKQGYFRSDLPASWLVLLYDHMMQAASEGIRKGLFARSTAPRMVCTSFLRGTRENG